MEVVTKAKEMQDIALTLKKEGKSIGFVPTMGYFHEGHLSLMRKAREENDIVVVSIFVNPLQFGPNEDYERYPRDEERDLKLAGEVGVDYVFMPTVEELYPDDFSTYVEVEKLTEGLCGRCRPGHFRGVTTVVAKLFNIVQPNRAYFGKKDYQQLKVIQRMVRDLNFPIEIVPCPTVREPDGLAMSSRNKYLSPDERKSALSLYKSLKLAEELIKSGERNPEKVKKEMEKLILNHPHVTKIDYIEIVDPEDLEPVKEISSDVLVALAAWVGKARLIDNLEVRAC